MRVKRAALAYWAVVFVLGFAFGTLRVLWLAPLVGLLAATAIELPVMLGASWLAAGWLVRRFAIAERGEAVAMGGLAFACLMLAECVLAVIGMGQTPLEWLTGLREPHALLGLAGQGLFAVFPWLRVRRGV